MVRFDEIAQFFVEHMGVDLRGRNIGMPEQHLDHAQVRATGEQMAGKGMAQNVGRDAVR